MIRIGAPSCAFSARIAGTSSPFSTEAFVQPGSFRVRETTSFSIRAMPSATSGIAWRAASVGQKPAIISQVLRPKSSVPRPLRAFSDVNAAHSGSPAAASWAQRMSPWPSTKYPSSDTFSNTVSFLVTRS